MKRFLNKRIKSLKSSSSRKSSSSDINSSKDKKYKEILNGPPPILTSELNKDNNNQSVTVLRQKISEEPEKEFNKSVTALLEKDKLLDSSSINNPIIDEPKDSGTDSSENLISRLFSTFRNNGKNNKSNKQDSTKELYDGNILNKDSDNINNSSVVSNIIVDEKQNSKQKKTGTIKKLFSSNKNEVVNTQMTTFQPRINRSGSKLDVIRIVNAEYVNPKNRLPENINYEFPSSNHRVYCFTVVKNLNNPVNVSHYWYRNGNFMARVPMDVGYSSSWRCWSYITLREGFEGNWKVVVRGPNNEELEEVSFTIFPNRNLAKQKR